MIKLNIGCGKKIIDGYKNYDINPINEQIEFIDVTDKLPFTSNYADEILLSHIVEHLCIDKQLQLIYECHRVLKKNGILKINSPSFSPVVFHNVIMYHKEYFNGICKVSNVSAQDAELFELVLAKPVFTLYGLAKHIRCFLQSFLFTEWKYEFKK